MVDEGLQQPGEGEWVSLAQASERVGVSIQTLRRRIRDGKLPARKISSPYGVAWTVSLSKLDGEVNTRKVVDEGGSSTGEGVDRGGSPTEEENGQAPSSTLGMVEALELIERLQQEVVAKAEAASIWQGRAEMLSLQLGLAQERVLALEAPKEEPKAEESKAEANLLPWWRWWWRKLAAG
jgi:hypothetical protein